MNMNLIEYDFASLIHALFSRNESNDVLAQRYEDPMRHLDNGVRHRSQARVVVPRTEFVDLFQGKMRVVKLALNRAGVWGDDEFFPFSDDESLRRTAEEFNSIEARWDMMDYETYDFRLCRELSVTRSSGMELFYRHGGFVGMYMSQGTLYGFIRKSMDFVYDRVCTINRQIRAMERGLNASEHGAVRSSYVRSMKQLAGFLRVLEGANERYLPGVIATGLRMNIKIAENFVELNLKKSMGEDFVLDFEGNKIPSNEALVLTAQSDFEGEYIHSQDAVVHDGVRVWGGDSSVVLTQDDDDRTLELVGGDIIWEPDFRDDIRYVDAGSRDGEWAWVDDVLYCESDGCYYHNEDEGYHIFWDDRREEYLDHEPAGERTHEYHSGFRRVFYTPDTKYTIGFEVEKEDEGVLDNWDLDDADATDWCRESDGSLGDDGYEMVSPVYDLFDDQLDTALNGKTYVSRTLVGHINAEYTSNCGGHINIGQVGVRGEDFFDSIQAFVPLFLSIWRHRLGNSYSQIKRKPHDYKTAGKYSAVHIKGSYIELRLPPAVRNVTNLLWRRDLIRIVCENQNAKPLNVISMMLNPKTKLHQQLRKVYSVEMIHKIVSLYAQFADDLYSSYDFTNDGVGVFIKSAVRRLKNRKVKGTAIVSNTFEATTRLSNSFGSVYDMDSQNTKEYLNKVQISE